MIVAAAETLFLQQERVDESRRIDSGVFGLQHYCGSLCTNDVTIARNHIPSNRSRPRGDNPATSSCRVAAFCRCEGLSRLDSLGHARGVDACAARPKGNRAGSQGRVGGYFLILRLSSCS